MLVKLSLSPSLPGPSVNKFVIATSLQELLEKGKRICSSLWAYSIQAYI